VQELTANADLDWNRLANSFSNSFTRGPLLIQPERSASTTAEISSSSMTGGEKERYSERIFFRADAIGFNPRKKFLP
jgi:hypothetical protein